MAAQSSPSRPRVARRRRVFTLAEANRTLPLVSRIVRDIVQCHRQAIDLQTRLEMTVKPIKQPAEIRKQLETTLERLQEYADELHSLGAELKDPETGLIDFPSHHHGREICLCWKLNEAAIEHWHELHAGYAGRQVVSLLDAEA
jgi:hypothetical protein